MDAMNPRDMRRPEAGQRMARAPESYQEPPAGGFGAEMPEHMPEPRRVGKGPWILALTIIVVLVVLGFVFKDRLFKSVGPLTNLGTSSQYQAVFLTNGQVYFGKLGTAEDERYLIVENIYYLQVTPVLQTKTEGEPGTVPAETQQQLSLVKLGNELHGPVDKMFINRDQVLFYEDLKDDGRVVQAIKAYEEGQ